MEQEAAPLTVRLRYNYTTDNQYDATVKVFWASESYDADIRVPLSLETLSHTLYYMKFCTICNEYFRFLETPIVRIFYYI